jgi:AmmeMemoRadiSam system protein A
MGRQSLKMEVEFDFSPKTPGEAVFSLSEAEKLLLLQIARRAVEAAVCQKARPALRLEDLPERLRQERSTFVTLTRFGELRGCIGGLEACLPLALDVIEHAAAAARDDHRFPPVQPEELNEIRIEISCLTPPRLLPYTEGSDLAARLRLGVDGLVLLDGVRRATFLPQVWKKLPSPELFLGHLCLKMGTRADAWRSGKLKALVYQVEEFAEGDVPEGCEEEAS